MNLGKSLTVRSISRKWFARSWFAKPSDDLGAEPSWAQELQDAVAELARVNHSTEADFLAIGAKLSSFVTAARNISAEANAIKESLAGDTGRSVCDSLAGVLDDTANREHSATASRELIGMREAVGDIRRSLSSFKQVGPSFQVMAALARIETSHLGSAGVDLGHLADEFRSAGDGIQSRVQYILDSATTLETRLESALKDVAAFDERSHHTLDALLATASQGLNNFQARQEKSAATVIELGAESTKLAKSISDLVASIQFHDITRQQVEHVVDALRKLDGKDALTNKAHAVIYLQLAQLENASSAFGSAVTRMDADLEQIAGRINRMLEHSASLSGASAGSESSLHVQMDECFRAIAHASADRSQLDRQTASAFASLQDTLDSLKRSAFEIHRVELQLRWLAINAAISAAHIGEKGEPLEAIAAAMQQLLVDCEKSSSAADQSIGSISEIFRLALAGANVSENEGSDELLQRLGNQIDQLHSLDERSASRTAELASTASRLSAEVEQLRNEFSAGRLFASAAANCCTVLRRIQEQLGANQTASDYAQLHELKQQYTMQAELDIHNRIFASQAPEASDTKVVMVSEPVASGEFDDNVELF